MRPFTSLSAKRSRLEKWFSERMGKGGRNMNNQLETFARDTLKQGLSRCTKEQQFLFKRMYAHGNTEMSLNDVVDQMETSKLDWAMNQVQRTLGKLSA